MGYTHFYMVFVLGFLFYGSTAEANKTNCTKILHQVADAQMNFVGCMVRNSSPANSCVECYKNHTSLIEKYTKLVSNATCSKEMLNQNRLNIVYNMQKDLVDVWNKGFCDDCFADGTLSNETIAFNNFSTKLNDCIKDNIVNTCIKCTLQYADLNAFYKQMDEAKGGRICFDTQDKMNTTRSHWSKELKCCHREYNLTFFIIASSFFTALPIIFYFGMFGYTKRLERNHEVLDADLNTEHASASTGVQSGTTSHIEERTSRRGSSSDEEIIDNLKKQNSVHPDKVKTIKNVLKPSSSATPTSSNEIGTLIEL